ncbi:MULTISPECIES: MdtA/MuxA family multidrug efflux RND transporter periplasmic adaptor subunit [unclassified Pseudomonas]|uniref:MdtA/MuxA family multidrug efflux RND transporter periplasmic adaptor subunit n=1 Tax=unclassified Pseudomonas TaxID=196821 RepID=UPI0019120B72|nr:MULTISPECIES: MdtA/MuxA family multidrug efflux RND transporter periplasmic adaptor subunit [unclassified Pseudomonas]MBK5512412.1 MdtA/MuxA family multidrug efflux RND transporter periplasmic adaptor subunit [Pseudomonas sp. TH15]MBK5553740.1 MdtA/MuxA family multidrug efflux RND transporter periplasmic adaptor subunit [Pseudomonas sp. TH03]MEB0225449.1 MdtA/MuxA family multidrug efflux RND transporter periplasmic adaptor subunit [Pseudomonas sp. 5S1]MEB0297703.1 MdtA/MuxA family multidrug 
MVDHSMQSSSRSPRRWLFGLLVLLIVAGVCWKFWPAGTDHKAGEKPRAAAGHTGKAGGMRPGFGGASGPIPVRVAPAVKGDFPLYYKALGTVTALNTINVRSRVAGELMKVAFEEGQMVKAGDLLAEIDPRPYQNALLQAEGTLLQNQAQLKNAQVDVERYRGLFKEDSIAKQTLDTAEALVGQYLGTVKTNQAAVNDAKLNLEFTKIRAPITGRVGLRQLDVGNLVAANDTTALAIITQTQPISVVFTLPENSLDTVLARYHTGAKLPVEAWDRGDMKLQASGVLQSLDNQIDVTTGTLKFKARYENRDQALFPNQFVNVHLLADTLKDVTLAPSAAIQFGTNGTFVYAMDGDKKVTIRQLKVGPSDGNNTVITEGLAVGDRVVLEGTDRLKEGSEVEVVNDTQDVPTTPTEHLQGKSAAKTPDATANDKAKKGA